MEFKDIINDNAYGEMIEIVNDGIMTGDENGLFFPDLSITRKEMAIIWSKMKKFILNSKDNEVIIDGNIN